jgi:predicted membrane protein
MSNQELILQQPGYVQDQVGIQTNSIVQKSRMSVVSLSLIIAGVGFGLICLVGFLFNDYLYRLLLSPEEITEKDVAVLTGLM